MNPGENLKNRTLHFGRFSVDAGGERAFFDTKPVRLRRKACEVLAYLVLHQDRVVTVDELLDSLWPGLAVTPHSVTVIISTLRLLLARDESPSCSIENVYGRGYRFVLHTSPQGTAQTTASEPGAVSTRASECVMRDAELTQLERCRDLVRDGIAQVVLLGGDPGIGKSSLIRQFTRRTTETTDALVLIGSCAAARGRLRGRPSRLPRARRRDDRVHPQRTPRRGRSPRQGKFQEEVSRHP